MPRDLTRKVAAVPTGQTATFTVVAPGQADADSRSTIGDPPR